MKKINTIFAGLAVLASLCSCEDFLNRNPQTQLSTDSFFSQDADFAMAADGLYTYFTRSSSDFYLDMRTDMAAIFTNKSGNRSYPFLYDGTMTTSSLSMFWDYTGIRRAHILLEQLAEKGDAISSKEKFNLYEGTAYFMLAYQYFKMFQGYESVPLITKVVTVEECDIAKSSKEDVWAYALDCVKKACSDMPSLGPGAHERGRLTKLAALTLKADMTLYAASYYNGALTGASWNDAATAASEALTEAKSTGYGLADDFDALFNCDKQAGADAQKEIIFEWVRLQNLATTSTSYYNFGPQYNNIGWADTSLAQEMVDRVQYLDGKRAYQSSLYDPAKPWDNLDPRFDMSMLYPGKLVTFSDGSQFIYNSLASEYYDADGVSTGTENKDWIFSTESSIDRNAVGYLCIKYWDRHPDRSAGYTSFINYRYGELLLMYAEAMLGAKGACNEVYSALTELRARPSVNMPAITAADYPDVASLTQLIRDERVIELMFEGKRYWDNKRWHRMAESVEMKHNIIRAATDFDANGNPTAFADKIELRTSVNDPTKTEVFELPAQDDPRINFHVGHSNGDRDYIWPIPQNAIDRSNTGALVQHDLWK